MGYPLLEAVEANDVDLVKKLIGEGVDINAGYFEETALSLAAYNNNHEIVDLLLYNGAKDRVDADEESNSMTALYAAINGEGDCDMIQKLLDIGADPNGLVFDEEMCMQDNTISPLWLAIYKDKYDVAQMLIDAGADMDYTVESEDCNYIPLVTMVNDKDFIKLMIDKGVDINAYNSSSGWEIYQRTMLTEFVYQNDHEMVEYLIDHGAKVDNDDYTCPIIFSKDDKMFELLMPHVNDFASVYKDAEFYKRYVEEFILEKLKGFV